MEHPEVGMWVIYTPTNELGRIKSTADSSSNWIFVVFHCDEQWEHFLAYTAEGVRPEQLRRAEEGKDFALSPEGVHRIPRPYCPKKHLVELCNAVSELQEKNKQLHIEVLKLAEQIVALVDQNTELETLAESAARIMMCTAKMYAREFENKHDEGASI